METDELTVDPGSQITTTVTVRNLGTRVEEFQLILQGPGAAFASITPDTLSVYPDLEQRAVVRFTPPRGPQSPAGVTTFEVVARSAVHSDVRDVVRGRLTVTPFQDLSAVLTPDVSRGRKPARHLVSVTNGGNTPVDAQLAFKDQDGVLTFEPQQGTATLQPGDKADLPVLINGPRRWFGRTERLAFAALITAPEPHPPITLNGTRQQTPVFPWWMPTAAVAIIALAIALAALLRPGKAMVPVVGQLDETQAVQLLRDARYLPESVPQKDNDVPQGKVIGTDPKGGAELARGQRVKLFVSAGQCDGPCPLPVELPNVVGLSLAEAQARLEQRNFTVRTVEATNEAPAGQVVASDPTARTPLQPGSEVLLTVSSGPKEENKPAAPIPPVVAQGGSPAEDKAAETKAAEEKAAAEKKAAEEKAAAEKKAAEDKAAADKAAADKAAAEKPIKVPDLKGGSVADATAALEKLGLTAKTVNEHSNAVPNGRVISTKPDVNSEVKPGSEVALTVAQNTVPVDLIATAGQAAWTNGVGNTLDFPGKEGDTSGFVRQFTGTVEGSRTTVLATNPQQTGAVRGEYTLPKPVVAGDHVVARVGLLKDTTASVLAEATSDVIFRIEANTKVIKTVTVSSADDKFQQLDADLSSAEGATAIKITVLTDKNSTQKLTPVWQNLRLEPKVKK